jgi:hypothetical protein
MVYVLMESGRLWPIAVFSRPDCDVSDFMLRDVKQVKDSHQSEYNNGEIVKQWYSQMAGGHYTLVAYKVID